MKFTSVVVINEQSLVPEYTATLVCCMADNIEIQIILDETFHYGRLKALIPSNSKQKGFG